jgi:hypothetical protein
MLMCSSEAFPRAVICDRNVVWVLLQINIYLSFADQERDFDYRTRLNRKTASEFLVMMTEKSEIRACLSTHQTTPEKLFFKQHTYYVVGIFLIWPLVLLAVMR